MQKTFERGAYVVVGAADLAAEKVREIPAVRKVREVSLFEQVRDIEPKLRRNTQQLGKRGEKVVARLRARTAEFRRSVAGLPAEGRKTLDGFRTDPRARLEQIRTRVSGLLTRDARPAEKKATKAA